MFKNELTVEDVKEILGDSITVEGKGRVFYTSYLRCESVAPLKIKFPVKQICS
jgi:hypothetical protein